MTEEVKATYYGMTDVGCVRTNNEDNLIVATVWDDSHLLLSAIDGIGGYEGGEVAAEIARSVIIEVCRTGDSSDCLGTLKKAVTMANNSIVEHKRVDPKRSSMGCVATTAIIDLKERRVYMVHVGDSRLYSYNASEGLKKLSHDHSLVGYREEIGQLTEQQAMAHPQRNIIERSLGDVLHNVDDPGFLDAGIFGIYEPTQYLFCSDGLSDLVYSAEIASVLASEASVTEKVETLIEMAKKAGGKDNITCVIAEVDVPKAAVAVTPEVPEEHDAPEAAEATQPLASLPQAVYQETEADETYAPEDGYQNSKPKKKMTLQRFRTLIITVALTFIVGGTVGYFIGYYTAKIDADKKVEMIRQQYENRDSVITPTNQPTDTIADPQRVGENVADSLNSEHKAKVDTATVSDAANKNKPKVASRR